MHRGWRAAVLAAGLAVGGVAGAHEFECQKRVNGQVVAHVEEYPTTVRFDYRIDNLHPTSESVVLQAEDPLLAGRGWSFSRAMPLVLPVGGSEQMHFMLQVGSHEECRALAAQDGVDDGAFDSSLRVVWPMGENQCGARLVCDAPYAPPPPRDCSVTWCPEPRTTRDEGYFKVYESVLEQCVMRGPVNLGALGTVSTLPQALGVLWGSPTLYPNGQPRSQLDASRFLLARQLLVARCNARLFGSLPVPGTLLKAAEAALAGTACQPLQQLRLQLREENVEGLNRPLPPTFKQGQPTPAHAQGIAQDFTQPSGQSCTGTP